MIVRMSVSYSCRSACRGRSARGRKPHREQRYGMYLSFRVEMLMQHTSLEIYQPEVETEHVLSICRVQRSAQLLQRQAPGDLFVRKVHSAQRHDVSVWLDYQFEIGSVELKAPCIL